jgi:hypothetical protein
VRDKPSSVKRFVVAMAEVFGLEYLRASNVQDMARLLAISTPHVLFQAFLPPLIACTRGGRTILRHEIDSSKDRRRTVPSFLKPWPTRRRGFRLQFLR